MRYTSPQSRGPYLVDPKSYWERALNEVSECWIQRQLCHFCTLVSSWRCWEDPGLDENTRMEGLVDC